MQWNDSATQESACSDTHGVEQEERPELRRLLQQRQFPVPAAVRTVRNATRYARTRGVHLTHLTFRYASQQRADRRSESGRGRQSHRRRAGPEILVRRSDQAGDLLAAVDELGHASPRVHALAQSDFKLFIQVTADVEPRR